MQCLAMQTSETFDPVLVRLFDFQPRKGDRLKVAILKAAIRAMGEEGVESLTFESIGKRTGTRRSHVAYHFSDRDQIVRDAIRYITAMAQEMTVERLSRTSNPRESLRAIVDAAFDWAGAYPEQVSAMLLFHYYCSYRSDYRTLQAGIRAAGIARIQAILAAMGGKRRASSASAAWLIHSLVTGSIVGIATTKDKKSTKVLRDETIRAVLALAGA